MLPVSPLPWEDESRRQELPATLDHIVAGRGRDLIVPRTIVAKIQLTHPAYFVSLYRLGELLERWELVGQSPSSPNRLELYGQLDGVWHTAVIALASDTMPYSVLITFHRVYERKVLSRERNGRLRRRRGPRPDGMDRDLSAEPARVPVSSLRGPDREYTTVAVFPPWRLGDFHLRPRTSGRPTSC